MSETTPINEMTPEEYHAWRRKEIQRLIGMSFEEFREKWLAGELDDSDPYIALLACLFCN